MKIKIILLLCVILCCLNCNTKKEKNVAVKKEVYKDTIQSQKKLKTNTSPFKAVPMPSTLLSGLPFPTDSTVINKWVANPKYNTVKAGSFETNPDIINHGWDIWYALTAFTNQKNNDQPLRRFETWYSPQDITTALKKTKTDTSFTLNKLRTRVTKLRDPHQFHGAETSEDDVVSFVKYDPNAAKHIFENKLFFPSVLESMVKGNQIARIPDFPDSAVAIKPVFDPLTAIDKKQGKQVCDDCYQIDIWPGEQGNTNRKFGQGDWKNYAYVTLSGKTDKSRSIYNIDEFIHFRLNENQASYLNSKENPVVAGDYAILYAMHTTTREIRRWTWQTFFWSGNVSPPHKPSTEVIESFKPKQLETAAKNYAMAIAFSMVKPAQPYYGGSGKNAIPLFAYNPYLEAGFGLSTFEAGNKAVQKYGISQKVGNILNKYGMQTNCMSCHGQARYLPGITNSKGPHLYITDQYFDLAAPYFNNTVTLDFSWGIQGNLMEGY